MFRLDPRSSDPIYRQVVGQVKHLVAAGQLRPGDQLPPVRQLAADLKVNPNTVARAYTQLIGDGVLAAQAGRGTYVLENSPPARQRRARRAKLVAHVDQFLSDLERLGYQPGEVRKLWAGRFKAWRKSHKSPA